MLRYLLVLAVVVMVMPTGTSETLRYRLSVEEEMIECEEMLRGEIQEEERLMGILEECQAMLADVEPKVDGLAEGRERFRKELVECNAMLLFCEKDKPKNEPVRFKPVPEFVDQRERTMVEGYRNRDAKLLLRKRKPAILRMKAEYTESVDNCLNARVDSSLSRNETNWLTKVCHSRCNQNTGFLDLLAEYRDAYSGSLYNTCEPALKLCREGYMKVMAQAPLQP